MAPPPKSDGPLWRLGPGITGPSSGYRCFRRRPGCLASVRGVLWRIVSLLIVSHGNKGLWPCVGIFSLYTMLPVLLGCCVLLSEVFHHRMILGPSLDSAKARSSPSGAGVSCSPSVLCCLLAPLAPFFVCLVLWLACVVRWPPPALASPLDGRFLIGCCVLFVSSFAWIPRILPRHHSSPFHRCYIGLIFFGLRTHPRWVAPSLLPLSSDCIIFEFVLFSLGLFFRLLIGKGPSPFILFLPFVPRGAVDSGRAMD